ncbi:MAG: hypothetical protein JSW27_01575, partial [Phycisphaerales bacterium]
MEKVLRAMDVIPPFDSHCEPHRAGSRTRPAPPPVAARPGQGLHDKTPMVMFSDDVPPPADDDTAAIPTLDLGEKILAEQRRATAQRRRAPGAVLSTAEDCNEQEALLE